MDFSPPNTQENGAEETRFSVSLRVKTPIGTFELEEWTTNFQTDQTDKNTTPPTIIIKGETREEAMESFLQSKIFPNQFGLNGNTSYEVVWFADTAEVTITNPSGSESVRLHQAIIYLDSNRLLRLKKIETDSRTIPTEP